MSDRKRYNKMDAYLQRVSGNCISFPESIRLRNNLILKEVLEPLIEKMVETNELFRQLYKTKFFGGSYYDNLKIVAPDEYDIDLLLKFPKACKIEIVNCDTPGYVNMYLHETEGFEKFLDSEDEDWESFLDTEKVLSWMQGVVQKALNKFERCGMRYIFGHNEIFYVHFVRAGPAFTLNIKEESSEEYVFVDLVPCFSFGGDKWPEGFRMYIGERNSYLSDFFIVPKHPKNIILHETKYWRLSFQIQERHFIHKLEHLKPALKLLKKMRDVQLHDTISSYILKTVIMWEVSAQPKTLWIKNSLSYVFIHVLKNYGECLKKKEIKYFWDVDFNLLDAVHGDLDNLSNRIQYIINDIERNMPDKPYTVLKYILTSTERTKLYPSLFPPPKTTVTYQYTRLETECQREKLPSCSIL